MSLLYKSPEERKIEVVVTEYPESNEIHLDFYSDGGKFGTHEALGGYFLTSARLLEILQSDRNVFLETEIL